MAGIREENDSARAARAASGTRLQARKRPVSSRWDTTTDGEALTESGLLFMPLSRWIAVTI